MSDNKTFEPHLTHIVDGQPVMSPVSSLQPSATYRYVCRCGCGEIFERSGAEIKNTVPLLVKAQSIETPTTSTSMLVTTITTTSEIQSLDEISETGPTPEELLLVEAAMDNAAEQRRAAKEDPVMSEEESEPDPVIGDVVWSKATGKGPFVIIAGTFVDVRAARLEISVPESGVYVRERTRADELLRLDAWLVRDNAGRTATFPKAELTTVRQFERLNLTKILLWAATFGAFVLGGWFLHR